MRKCFLLIAILCLSIAAYSQSDTEVKLIAAIEAADRRDENHDREKGKAAEGLEKCDSLLANFPNSRYRFEALFKKGEFSLASNHIEEAKKCFNELLNCNEIVPYDATNPFNQKDFYFNYSLHRLGYIAAIEQQFQQAIDYFEASKKYRVNYGCENSWDADVEMTNGIIAALKHRLKEPETPAKHSDKP